MSGEEDFHRRSIRLPRAEYARPGTYFVTICAYERRCIFGRITNARMLRSELGGMALECWIAIPQHFPRVTLHEFVIMPNHLHGLVAITRDPRPPSTATMARATPLVGAQHCCALPSGLGRAVVTPGSLGAIVRSFKSIVARRAHEELGWKVTIWQRNYFERVLRNGKEFSDASRYIVENPLQWEWDRENREMQKVLRVQVAPE